MAFGLNLGIHESQQACACGFHVLILPRYGLEGRVPCNASEIRPKDADADVASGVGILNYTKQVSTNFPAYYFNLCETSRNINHLVFLRHLDREARKTLYSDIHTDQVQNSIAITHLRHVVPLVSITGAWPHIYCPKIHYRFILITTSKSLID